MFTLSLNLNKNLLGASRLIGRKVSFACISYNCDSLKALQVSEPYELIQVPDLLFCRMEVCLSPICKICEGRNNISYIILAISCIRVNIDKYDSNTTQEKFV